MSLSVVPYFSDPLIKNLQCLYPIAVKNCLPLPSSFVKKRKISGIVLTDSKLNLTDSRAQSDVTLSTVHIKSDHLIPLCCSLYYFEVSIDEKSSCGSISIGFSSKNRKGSHRGNGSGVAVLYNSNSGQVCWNGEPLSLVCPPFESDDVIGCGVNFVSNSMFFTKNGFLIGCAAMPGKLTIALSPCVLLISPETRVTANFGQHEFCFSISQHLAVERSNAVCDAIETQLTPELAHIKMRSLVSDYLLRNGYLDTVQAMWHPSFSSSDVNEVGVVSSELLSNSPSPQDTDVFSCEDWPESLDSAQRRIDLINHIEAGRYQHAIDHLVIHYPVLIAQNPSIVFMLRCQSFIQMIFNSEIHDECAAKVDDEPVLDSVLSNGTSPALFASPTVVMRNCRMSDSQDTRVTPTNRNCKLSHSSSSPAKFVRGIRRSTRSLNSIQNRQLINLCEQHTDSASSLQLNCNSPIELHPQTSASTMMNTRKLVDNEDSAFFSLSAPNTVQSFSPRVCSHDAVLRDLVICGRELRCLANELKASGAITLPQVVILENAFSLMAYEKPSESPLKELIHRRNRSYLAGIVNSAILHNLGKPDNPLLETGIAILEKAVVGEKPISHAPAVVLSSKLPNSRQLLSDMLTSSTQTPLSNSLSTTTVQPPGSRHRRYHNRYHPDSSIANMLASLIVTGNPPPGISENSLLLQQQLTASNTIASTNSQPSLSSYFTIPTLSVNRRVIPTENGDVSAPTSRPDFGALQHTEVQSSVYGDVVFSASVVSRNEDSGGPYDSDRPTENVLRVVYTGSRPISNHLSEWRHADERNSFGARTVPSPSLEVTPSPSLIGPLTPDSEFAGFFHPFVLLF